MNCIFVKSVMQAITGMMIIFTAKLVRLKTVKSASLSLNAILVLKAISYNLEVILVIKSISTAQLILLST